MMKRSILILVCGLLGGMPSALGQTVGISMSRTDDTFRGLLLGGLKDHAHAKGNVTLRVEDAKGDVDRQIQGVRDLVAAKVDAIVIAPGDGDSAPVVSKIAADAGVPLVYLNTEPVNIDELPKGQSFVASDENDSGTLQAREVCRRLGGKGNVVVMMGELLHYAARRRTENINRVLAEDGCKDIQIVEAQSAAWSKPFGEELMNEWLAAGVKFDAVIANNDDMALGAIEALKTAGLSRKRLVIAGIDATQPALAAMAAGDLDVTVFQNAKAQGSNALDAALALAKGQETPNRVYVPFELVTPENMASYVGRN